MRTVSCSRERNAGGFLSFFNLLKCVTSQFDPTLCVRPRDRSRTTRTTTRFAHHSRVWVRWGSSVPHRCGGYAVLSMVSVRRGGWLALTCVGVSFCGVETACCVECEVRVSVLAAFLAFFTWG